MKAKVYNSKLEVTDKSLTLSQEVWDRPMNSDLVSQAVLVYRSNKRQGTASAKGKGEVRGGGKKPWKQKGTGRARHGSIRSPIWVGGGVTFPPSKREWGRRLNKKMKLAALACVLSSRLKNDEIYLFEGSGIDRAVLSATTDKYVVVTSNPETYMGLRNVPNVTVVRDSELNAHSAMLGKKMLLHADSIPSIEGRFINNKEQE